AYTSLGIVLYRQEQADEAMSAFDKAIELDSRNGAAHNARGSILCDVKRDYEGALACFRKTGELLPDGVHRWANLSNTYPGLKQHDQAIAAYRKAIKVDPNYALTYYNLGWSLLARGQLEEAIAAFEEGVRLAPQNAGKANDLAWLLATCTEERFRNPARALE